VSTTGTGRKTLAFAALLLGAAAIAFAPIAESEDDLADILRERGLSMDELDGDFAGLVKDEFLNDPMLYPDPDQEPVEGEP